MASIWSLLAFVCVCVCVCARARVRVRVRVRARARVRVRVDLNSEGDTAFKTKGMCVGYDRMQ